MQDNSKSEEIERLNKIINVMIERGGVNNVCEVCGREVISGQDTKPSFLKQFFQGILIGVVLLIFVLILVIIIGTIFI